MVAEWNDVPSSSSKRAIGSLVDNKYRPLRLIGRGGMGDVYEAEHSFTKRRVALKLVQAATTLATPEMVDRFFEEAAAAAAIDHPGVIDVLDAGRDEDGSLYAAFELLQGYDLESALRDELVRPLDLVRIGVRLLDALSAVHASGFVHRDIKPGNVFLARAKNGAFVVKLIDFGIALRMDPDTNQAHPERGAVVGTVEYMSPEQASACPVDARSDLWSVAALLFRGLAGRPPFLPGNLHQTIIELTERQAPSLAELRPDLPIDLISLLDRGLERDPALRWASAGDMGQNLALCDEHSLASVPTAPYYLVRDPQRASKLSLPDTIDAGTPHRGASTRRIRRA